MTASALTDPVCGMKVTPDSKFHAVHADVDYYFCCSACREKFAADKPALKREIRALKAQRDAALAEHDTPTVHQARQRIKKHKRTLRRMAHGARAAAV